MDESERGEQTQKVAEIRSPYGEQDEWGNSIASLRINLKLTPLERLRKAEQAARSVQELRRALKRTS